MKTAAAFKFTAVSALPAQPAEWWTVLVEGNYQHPKYGPLPITRQKLTRLHENFQAGVYGQQVPLDLNHATGDQGAPGWIADTRTTLGEDGKTRLQIKPELNSYGKLLVGDKRVKYLSAEFYNKFPTFAHGEVEDLMTGTALTQKPWMKNLGPISCAEDSVRADDEAKLTKLTDELATGDYPVLFFEEAAPMANEPTPAAPVKLTTPPPAPTPEAPVTLTAEEVRQLRAQADENRQLREELKASSATADSARRIALAEQALRVRTELKQTFAGLQFSDKRYKLGEPLCAELADYALTFTAEPPKDAEGKVLLGEDNKPLTDKRTGFIKLIGAIGEGLVALGTKGFSSPAIEQDGDPKVKLHELTIERMKAQKALGQPETYDVACEAVLAEQPELGKAIQI